MTATADPTRQPTNTDPPAGTDRDRAWSPRPVDRWVRVTLWATWLVAPAVVIGLILLDAVFHWRDHGHVPVWAFASGLGAAAVVAGLVLFASVYRARSEAQVRHHLRALESLHGVTAAIGARIGQGSQVLQQVADVSRDMLGFAMSTISLLDRNGMLHVLCASGPTTRLVGMQFPVDRLVALRQVLTDGRTIVVEDVDRTDQPIDREGLRAFDAHAVLIVPLRAQGRILGALLLADERPRRIREQDVRLAELWGSQAAVIVLNHKLYEKMQTALGAQKRLQEQREAMLLHSLAIYEDDSLDDALQRVADEVPRMLAVDLLTVSLLTDRPHELQMTAATTAPQTLDLIGSRFSAQNMVGDDCLHSGLPVAVDDASKEPRLHPRFREQLGVGSILFVPLLGNAGVIGMLTLIRRAAGAWAPETVQTATYLGQRAAAAIETARLYQQTRADAQTKAMLLRELHHRVKNNLAGIVSLLSINQPELPDPARQWLNRATERIRVMARAHELFTGQSNPLRMNEIMQIMLSSLSVLKPPSVRIETRLEDADVSLEADRAVALVMVLHELCHNAIVHGLGDHGTLTIVARPGGGQPPEQRTLVLEVTDHPGDAEDLQDGPGGRIGPEPDADVIRPALFSTGMGLSLVRGLVGRELHGQFTLAATAEGGTRARVEFPLDTPDSSHLNGRRNKIDPAAFI